MELELNSIVFIYLTFSILCLITFILLLQKLINDRGKHYTITSITRILALMTFFLFLTGCYNFVLKASQFGLISQTVYYRIIGLNVELIPNLGILVSTIFLVYFIMQNKIEEFKKKEDSLIELDKFNHDLEKKAVELESSQEKLQKKVVELEKYNEIAKDREKTMIDLIKKIDTLEKKVKKRA